MMGISIWQLLIILVIVLLLFGTKKIRNIGGDLGGAIKNFRGAMKEGGKTEDDEAAKVEETKEEKVIEGEVTSKETDKG